MADPDQLGDPSAGGSSAGPRALSCLTLPSFSDACALISRRYSYLVVKTHRRHLALPPKYLHKKRSGIKEHLSAELLKYNVLLEGVPLAYDNIKLVGELGDIHDDVGYIHINIEADFVIFQPKCGQKLVGVINKKAPSHIGCLVHGCFNASIPRPLKIPVDAWQQMEVNIGDQMEFEVFRLDSDAVGVFSIRGRLDKKLEAEIIKKLEAVSEEQNANVLHHEGQDASEIAVGEKSVFSEEAPKKKRKRSLKETLSQNECIENQEDTNLSLEEAPKKKKRKKHRQLEVLSQVQSVEVDGSGDNSSMEVSSTHWDSLQNTDSDLAVDNGGDGLVTSVVLSSQEHKTKRSKKKKHKDQPDLESSLHNGREDSLIAEDSTLEATEPGTPKKKRKKKHRPILTSLDQDPVNDTASSLETPTDNFGIQQETPKMKKHKKKR